MKKLLCLIAVALLVFGFNWGIVTYSNGREYSQVYGDYCVGEYDVSYMLIPYEEGGRSIVMPREEPNPVSHQILNIVVPSVIEIGIIVGLYFAIMNLKTHPENSWKKAYVCSCVLILTAVNAFIFIYNVQLYCELYQKEFGLATVMADSLFAVLIRNIPLNLVLVGIAALIFLMVALDRKGKDTIGFIVLLCIMGLVATGLYVYLDVYRTRARSAVPSVRAHAPIIYLYDENDEDELINVMLDLDGELDVTYPLYDESCGWTVTASSDGLLEDEDGNTYPFLFWEATLNMDYDLSSGFCVRGCDTEVFLNEALAELGLNEKEAADFMSYWLPLMEDNEYNVITFQTTAYTDAAGLNVTPAPDVTVRINMLWYASSDYVEIEPQQLEGMNPSLSDREGLTLVEWGGEVIDEPVTP